MNQRALTLKRLRWELGPVLPADMRANMGRREAEFHTGYDNLLTDYMAQVGGLPTLRGKPPAPSPSPSPSPLPSPACTPPLAPPTTPPHHTTPHHTTSSHHTTPHHATSPPQVGVDITSDLSPPKELMVEVRVLEDVGEVMMESGSVNLAKGTQHSLKRADVEHLVRQGYLEELERHESC